MVVDIPADISLIKNSPVIINNLFEYNSQFEFPLINSAIRLARIIYEIKPATTPKIANKIEQEN